MVKISDPSEKGNDEGVGEIMHKSQGKPGVAAGGISAPAKRGRPQGSGTNSAAAAAAAAAAAETAAPSTLLGPTLQVHSAFAGQF